MDDPKRPDSYWKNLAKIRAKAILEANLNSPSKYQDVLERKLEHVLRDSYNDGVQRAIELVRKLGADGNVMGRALIESELQKLLVTP